jgi:hypothetical protein
MKTAFLTTCSIIAMSSILLGIPKKDIAEKCAMSIAPEIKKEVLVGNTDIILIEAKNEKDWVMILASVNVEIDAKSADIYIHESESCIFILYGRDVYGRQLDYEAHRAQLHSDHMGYYHDCSGGYMHIKKGSKATLEVCALVTVERSEFLAQKHFWFERENFIYFAGNKKYVHKATRRESCRISTHQLSLKKIPTITLR